MRHGVSLRPLERFSATHGLPEYGPQCTVGVLAGTTGVMTHPG